MQHYMKFVCVKLLETSNLDVRFMTVIIIQTVKRFGTTIIVKFVIMPSGFFISKVNSSYIKVNVTNLFDHGKLFLGNRPTISHDSFD